MLAARPGSAWRRVGGRRSAALVLVWLLSMLVVGAAGAEPRVRVEYRPPLLTVDAEDATVSEILEAIGQRVGFSVVETGDPGVRLTGVVSGSVETVLKQILAGTSHALVYWDAARGTSPGASDVEKILVLRQAAGVGGSSIGTSGRSDIATMSRPTGSTPALDEDAGLALSRLLRDQAVGGATSPAEPRPPESTVETITLEARKNVETLVDALNAAGQALMNSARPIAPPQPGTRAPGASGPR